MPNSCALESRKNATDCTRNIVRKTARRPMASESHAQMRRPDPLAMEIIPTSPAAVAAETPAISCAMGAACEMIAIPAVVFRNSVNHSAYHCHVPSACRNEKSYFAFDAADCVYPAGAQPAGGFCITDAHARTTTRYAAPRISNVRPTPTDAISDVAT